MRTCLKNGHENGKNAKMNSSTQKCFTLKNVWKLIFENWHKKWSIFKHFTLKVRNKLVFSIEIVWKMVILKIFEDEEFKISK